MAETGKTSFDPWVLRPKTLNQIRGQKIVIDYLKSMLAQNKIPPAMLFHGPAGTGKTSTICAFLRTVLCQQRPPGGLEPCLECASCRALDDPRDGKHENVIWVQVGKGHSRGEDSINSQVSAALEAAKLGPGFPDEPHRHYKFIVVDEVQNLPVHQLQRFLFFPEAVNHLELHGIRMIFSTMNLHRINPDTAPSFIGRTVPLPFHSPSLEELNATAADLIPQVREAIRLQLCDYVHRRRGGYRELFEMLERFSNPTINFNPEIIKSWLGEPSLEEIDKFFYLCATCQLGSRGYLEVQEYYRYLIRLCQEEPRVLYQILMRALHIILTLPGAEAAHFEALKGVSLAYSQPWYDDQWILQYFYGLPYVSLIA